MKALITGAGGQLGRCLGASVPEGWTCLALSRAELDFLDPDAVRGAVRKAAPDLVLNAAAYTAVDRAEKEPDVALAINATAVAALADATRECGAHLVHLSTAYVFDGKNSRPYRPDDTRNPVSEYGRSKAAGEDAAGEDATILRTSRVYSAGGANFVSTMLRLMRERDELRVVADQIGSPTWANGLAEVVWDLGMRKLGGVWHHSDAGVASWYDFAVAIQEEALAAGVLDRAISVAPISTKEHPTTAPRPACSLLDSSATHASLGTVPVHWRVNLRRMIAELARPGSFTRAPGVRGRRTQR